MVIVRKIERHEMGPSQFCTPAGHRLIQLQKVLVHIKMSFTFNQWWRKLLDANIFISSVRHLRNGNYM